MELLDAEAQSFRIDRLVTDGERSVVLDFKTGNKEISHSRQLNHYVDLLKQTGCQQVEAFWYIYIPTEHVRLIKYKKIKNQDNFHVLLQYKNVFVCCF